MGFPTQSQAASSLIAQLAYRQYASSFGRITGLFFFFLFFFFFVQTAGMKNCIILIVQR